MVTESSVESLKSSDENTLQRYKNGVRHGLESTLVTDLGDVVGLHCSILRSPIFVLSEASAKKTKRIITKTKEGSFTIMAGETPLPTAKHAFYFDILCSMFAMNWNLSGVLHYRWSDVLKIAGKNPRSSNSLQALIETVRRYMGTYTSWRNTFELSDENSVDWNGSLILQSSVFDDNGNSNVKKIGRNKSKDHWNWIKLHPELVEALNPSKDPKTRLLLSSTFQLDLKQAEHVIYRYFYGHWDTKEVWRSLYKPHEGLIDIFKWGSHKSQFLPWLKKVLDGLIKNGLVEYYDFNDDKSAIGVKCKNISEIKQGKKEITLESESVKTLSRQPSRKTISIKKEADNIPDDVVLTEYIFRKSKGLLDASTVDTIDSLLTSLSDAKSLIPAIKRVLLDNEKSNLN